MKNELQNVEQSSKGLESKLLIYQTFQNNNSYRDNSSKLKERILNSQHQILLQTISVLKNILSVRPLSHIQDILTVQKQLARSKNNFGVASIQLSEYSMLLALRFIRDLYFQSYYPFILLLNLQLSEIFQSIASFRSQLNDQQRGKLLFTQPKPSIFLLFNNKASKHDRAELERIGFSIHKFVLQVLKKSAAVYKLIPYHQQFCGNSVQLFSCFFYSPFYKIFTKLVNKKVKFPQNYHYFKSEEHINFIKKYKATDGAKYVRYFYTFIFEAIWSYVSNKVQAGVSKHQPFDIYGQVKCPKIQNLMTIVYKIGCETNDRYFWLHLDIFLQEMLANLQQQEYSIQKVKTKYFSFIGFIASILRNSQIIAYVEKNHIEAAYQHFVEIMRHSQKIQSKQIQQTDNSTIPTQQQLEIFSLAVSLLNMFKMLNNILVTTKNILRKPCLFESLTLYLNNVVRISVKPSMASFQSNFDSQFNQSKRQNDLQYQKYNFLVKYFSLTENKLSSQQRLQLKQKMKGQINELFESGMKFFYAFDEIEQINMAVDQISQRQIQSVVENCKSVRGSSLQRWSCYKLSKVNTGSQNFSNQKSSANFVSPSRYSFKESLKIHIPRVSCQSIKNLLNKKKKSVFRGSTPQLPVVMGQLVSKIEIEECEEEFNFKQSEPPSISAIKSIDSRSLQLRKIANRERLLKQRNQGNKDQNHQERIAIFVSESNFQSEKKSMQPQNLELFKQNTVDGYQNTNQLKRQSSLQIFNVVPKSSLFCFALKTKKELLKTRCLLKKTNNIELGVSTTFEQQVVLSRNGFSRHNSIISIFLTAITQLENIQLKIDFPSWIALLESNNANIKEMGCQSQQVIKFKISPKLRKDNLQLYNFGKLPVLHLKFEYQGQSHLQYIDIPFLITKFTIQHRVTIHQCQDLLKANTFIPFMEVNHKIATQMHQIRHFFTTIMVIDAQKLSQYKKWCCHLCDAEIVGLIKMQFLLSKLSFYVIFKEESSSKDKRSNRVLLFSILTINNKKWDDDQLQIIKTCFTSILVA